MNRMDRKALGKTTLGRLSVYKPYVARYTTTGPCFFERGIGYWAYQEEAVQKKIEELEAEGMTTYAIIHGKHSELGELWDFLVIDNDMETLEDVISSIDGDYALLSVCCDSDMETIDIGDIGVRSRYGGLIRVW